MAVVATLAHPDSVQAVNAPQRRASTDSDGSKPMNPYLTGQHTSVQHSSPPRNAYRIPLIDLAPTGPLYKSPLLQTGSISATREIAESIATRDLEVGTSGIPVQSMEAYGRRRRTTKDSDDVNVIVGSTRTPGPRRRTLSQDEELNGTDSHTTPHSITPSLTTTLRTLVPSPNQSPKCSPARKSAAGSSAHSRHSSADSSDSLPQSVHRSNRGKRTRSNTKDIHRAETKSSQLPTTTPPRTSGAKPTGSTIRSPGWKQSGQENADVSGGQSNAGRPSFSSSVSSPHLVKAAATVSSASSGTGSVGQRSRRASGPGYTLREDLELGLLDPSSTFDRVVQLLSSDLKTVRSHLDSALRREDTLQVEVNTLTGENTELMAVVQRLVREKEVILREREEYKSKCAETDQELNTIRHEMDETLNELKLARRALRESEQTVRDMDKELEAVRNQLAASEGTIRILQAYEGSAKNTTRTRFEEQVPSDGGRSALPTSRTTPQLSSVASSSQSGNAAFDVPPRKNALKAPPPIVTDRSKLAAMALVANGVYPVSIPGRMDSLEAAKVDSGTAVPAVIVTSPSPNLLIGSKDRSDGGSSTEPVALAVTSSRASSEREASLRRGDSGVSTDDEVLLPALDSRAGWEAVPTASTVPGVVSERNGHDVGDWVTKGGRRG
ncbi:hypothetical protein HDU93_000665 [Gonapodya sp. JEL0774]|nr:hypothetical protein HDU93_000665 [Gonapodya sp. JEL0774]